jgi:hypothetical protein
LLLKNDLNRRAFVCFTKADENGRKELHKALLAKHHTVRGGKLSAAAQAAIRSIFETV